LDEINAGICDGMTYEQIKLEMPGEYEARSYDKFRYRYPRGESYEDVIARLDTVVIELERTRKPVLVIAHQAVLRAIYAYFHSISPEQCTRLPMCSSCGRTRTAARKCACRWRVRSVVRALGLSLATRTV
jgi:6-phosphofructo-2-kinase/fructose-2,6-biphosphatase